MQLLYRYNNIHDCFTNIGNEIAAKIPPSNGFYRDTIQKNILSCFEINDIDDFEVMNNIISLKTKASPELHGLSAKYFKILTGTNLVYESLGVGDSRLFFFFSALCWQQSLDAKKGK